MISARWGKLSCRSGYWHNHSSSNTVSKGPSSAVKHAHRCANFEVVGGNSKSMMPVSVMEVDYASGSIANGENLKNFGRLASILDHA